MVILFLKILFYFLLFFFFAFFGGQGAAPAAYEIPRLGVELEL